MATNEDLVKDYQNGKPGALAALVAQNEGLIHKLSQGYANPHEMRFDDCLQESRMAVMDAARCFDLSRGLRFTTYAWWAIVRRLQTWARNEEFVRRPGSQKGPRCHVLSVEEVPRHEGERRFDLEDTSQRMPDDVVSAADHRNRLQSRVDRMLKDRLNTRERRMLMARMAGKTLKQVAAREGVCKERVRQITAKAMQKLGAK